MTTYATPPASPAGIKAELILAGHAMLQAALPAGFVGDAIETAFKYEGVADLVILWRDEDDASERDAIVADLQELIDDCAKKGPSQSASIHFSDLETIAQNIRVFKDNLRLLVDAGGGVGRLAERTGIPQPSLSRFFGSAAMPRRATLLKIAQALELSEVHIATPWAR